MKAWNGTPYAILAPDIVSSDGCYLYDRRGNRYADFESGVWCASVGHNNPEVNRALEEQGGRIGHTGYRCSSRVVERAAEMVLDVLGMPDGQSVFLSSGSEAVEFAVQAAKRIREESKPLILCLKDYFLSSYGQSAARPEGEWIALDLSQGDESDWERELDRIPFHEIGIFVLEPGNASGLVRLPPKEIVSRIASRVRQSGGLVVVDEVTTGIGRTGKWFGFEHYDLLPDLVACGKGIGNGYPVSCVGMRGDIGERLLRSGFRYAQSHQNDPLGCAVVCAVLSQIADGGLISRAAEAGAHFLEKLSALARETAWIREVRGRGLMLAVELSPAAPLEDIHQSLFERGYLVGVNGANHLLRMYPPLVVERRTLDDFVQDFRQVLLGV